MPTLPCENGGGSLNNPNGTPAQIGTNNPALKPYVPPTLPIGDWAITGLNPDTCGTNEQLNQQTYVAETLNISGAPMNVFKLLGIHDQGVGSILSEGRIITSAPYPGYPASGINTTSWRSLASGANVTTSNVYVGVDFGIKVLSVGGTSEYEPQAQKWTDVGAISITQSNVPGYWAQQVRVELTTGDVSVGATNFTGTGTGLLTVNGTGSDATQGVVTAVAITATTFNCYATLPDNTVIGLGTATVGVPFYSTFLNFTISDGMIPFVGGDMFSVVVVYNWNRVAMFNLIQTNAPQILNLKTVTKVKAIRVTPTLFTGANSWEVLALDVLDSPPTDINNIQDLFFNENRDRDYAKEPLLIKCQYTPGDNVSDLSRFGLSMLDQYVFTVSFAAMVQTLGRPIVTGDIIEVIPELQYDQNLMPIRKFLEVTDTAWAASGYGPAYNPTVYRFNAQQALPSQETRDIFGTLDTQKYLIPDAILTDGIGEQLNTYPLTATEEINKNAFDEVPKTGSDDIRSVAGIPLPRAAPPANPKGQPPAVAVPNPEQRANLYIESALPPDDQPYGEGFQLPPVAGLTDGEYFRLYYPPETAIPPRLYRYSAVKNRWIYLETDRRAKYSSFKPSVQSIMQSANNQPLGKKLT